MAGFGKREQLKIEKSINRISDNPRYRKRIRDAVDCGQEIVLNYFSHEGEANYCISVLTHPQDLLSMAGEDKTVWQELVDIRSICVSEKHVKPIMKNFGNLLKISFGLQKLPDVYLNGKLLLKDA